jgi:uncharacterized protein with PIN domain
MNWPGNNDQRRVDFVFTNPCFAAEKTLGKLAKWLRLLGFDTLYESEASGEKFWESLEMERILLTRQQRFRKQNASRKLIFIQSDHWERQLNQVFRELRLQVAQTRPFSRCLHCNVPITAVEKESLRGRVPDYIFETHDYFQSCPECDRIYWPGSHTQRSLAKIHGLLD